MGPIELEDEEIELLVEEGRTPILVNRKQILKHNSNLSATPMVNPTHHPVTISGSGTGNGCTGSQWDDYDDESSASISIRDSFPLGAGCLPCTPKSQKKSSSNYSAGSSTGTGNKCQHGKSSNWCCGVVANSVKKTTKKF